MSLEAENKYESKDTRGYQFDFVLESIPNEKSTRKYIRPFRNDIIEKSKIKVGDYISGRPVGAGCPVTHILEVFEVDYMTGVLGTWAVGPLVGRKEKVIDISAYSMVGFEGNAVDIKKMPMVGMGASFLPGFCMLRLSHFGLVSKTVETEEGLLVRIEDIHIFPNMFLQREPNEIDKY